ncbi:MAG TPA: class I SAM-dependent methyltransferase [Kofleriaceae bacterium]
MWAERVLPFLIEKACRSSAILEERKRRIPRAHGEVLEVGVGTGLNFAFYDRERVTRVTGIDPSPALLAKARVRVASAPVPVELVEAAAEALPFVNHAFDSAVITYSLCSVADPARALAELRRVLRPGGELVIVEHGLAPDARTQRWQKGLTPVWRRIAGGCRLDRDHAALLRDAGFASEISSGYSEGAKLLSYTYEGIASSPR